MAVISTTSNNAINKSTHIQYLGNLEITLTGLIINLHEISEMNMAKTF